eukprot:TRINITY_DN9050_c0_g2_i1.p1 TRINITY_DN9050_c0_g2~~TRINITY_DN9050_c0_g2_i1.p1  ORF type:complete len:349 (+),score=26.66 TRINITY_DN9050_c0_g2_i1:54-1100(+)
MNSNRTVAIAAGSAVVGLCFLLKRLRRKTDGQEALARFAGDNPELTEASPGVRMLTTFSSAPVSSSPPGRTRPTLVLIHGFGCNSLEWSSVRRCLVDKGLSADVFAYDRILFVDGDALQTPRSATQLVEELSALLANRGITPPFVLVGHSYGGLVAQCFAMLRPKDVSGLVLIDPAFDDQFEVFPSDFSFGFKIVPMVFWIYRTVFAPLGLLKLMDRLSLFNFPPLYLYPTPERIAARSLYSDSSVWERASAELSGCNITFENMPLFRKQHEPLRRSLPCKLIIAAHRKFSPTLYPEKVTSAFVEWHRDLCSRLSIEPIMAKDSDHWVHVQQPELVAQAIIDVLVQVQ